MEVFLQLLLPVSIQVLAYQTCVTGKADFGDGWYTKLDVGFASNKVRLKDAFLQKTKNGHMLRIGYMIGMFSLDQSVSTNDYLFMTGANVAEIFYPGRRFVIRGT